MRLPKIFLIKEVKRHLRAGHPWVYTDALRVPANTPAGLVALCEPGPKARFLAYGLYQPNSPLAFRALSLQEGLLPDAALIQTRIESALSLRKTFINLQKTNAFRLLHGEGDFLPGLLCDLYHNVAVIKYDSAAAKALYDPVVVSSFLVERLHLSCVYERFYERAEGQPKGALRLGALPQGELVVKEEEILFGVDVQDGQKTGFFLDQRENRRLVRSLASQRTVLNCFSYTGGFSVAAALGGSLQTTSVDLAAPILEAAKKNFSRNGLDPSLHRFVAEDAFSFLRREAQQNQSYGLVILDPPSFAPNEKAREKALSAYQELNLLGLRVLAEGGVLCTASCSSHITEEDLVGALRDAAKEAKRPVRLVMRRGAGPDHPVPPAFSEGNYLKFLVAI